MSQDINRLLMELERHMRTVNREVINPQITELTIDGLEPAMRLVARARARYLRAFFDLGENADSEAPDETQIAGLRRLRTEYEELMTAARELEQAIQRGYLDVTTSAKP